MRIGFFGDIHGRVEKFHHVLQKAIETSQISVAIQVGDFGISKKAVKKLDALGGFPVPVHFIDGNHEDFRFLWKAMKKGIIKEWENKNLYFQPRGSTLVVQGTNIGFFGGALHVGRPQKIIKGNVITTDEVNRAVFEFSRFSPDIMITHSCPAGIGIGMQGLEIHYWGVVNHIVLAGFNPGPKADCGETQHTLLWNQMLQRPKLWVYGHFHEQKITEVEDTTFVSLSCLERYHDSVIWDTDDEALLLIPRGDCSSN